MLSCFCLLVPSHFQPIYREEKPRIQTSKVEWLSFLGPFVFIEPCNEVVLRVV
jgi:hypothetical protein